MSLERIRQIVLTEAKTEANHILENTKKKVSASMSAQKEQTERDSERHYDISTQAIEDEYRRKFLQYKGMFSKQILKKRNLLLGTIFEKARTTILNLPDEEYERFMGRLIDKASGSMGGMIHIHRDEKNIFSKIILETNKARSPEAQIILDETHPLNEPGGFIFVGAEYEVDQTLGTIFKDIEQEMMPVIAKELFSVPET